MSTTSQCSAMRPGGLDRVDALLEAFEPLHLARKRIVLDVHEAREVARLDEPPVGALATCEPSGCEAEVDPLPWTP